MRNVFDQYKHVENRVTHALMTALNEDQALKKSFVMDCLSVKCPVPANQLEISVQAYPGALEGAEQKSDQKSIPDAWIYCEGDAWAIVIESKVQAPFSTDQMRQHVERAQKIGYKTIIPVAITTRTVGHKADNFISVTWQEIFRWLSHQHKKNHWANKFTSFLQIVEARLIEDGIILGGPMTEFSGIEFEGDSIISSRRANYYLKLLTDEIRKDTSLCRDLRIQQNTGRSKVDTERGWGSWDKFDLLEMGGIHFSTSVQINRATISLVIPNKKKMKQKSNFVTGGSLGLSKILQEVIESPSSKSLFDLEPAAKPYCVGLHRHGGEGSGYQKYKMHEDGKVEFDLRTMHSNPQGIIKSQPIWLDTAYKATQSRDYNYEMHFGWEFLFHKCRCIESREGLKALKLAMQSLLPLIQYLLE